MTTPGDLDDQADHTRSSRFSVHDDDVPDLAEPVAHGIEDGAAGQARGENPLCAHGFQRSRRIAGSAVG